MDIQVGRIEQLTGSGGITITVSDRRLQKRIDGAIYTLNQLINGEGGPAWKETQKMVRPSVLLAIEKLLGKHDRDLLRR